MKTISELKKQKPVFLGFEDKKNVAGRFDEELGEGIHIIIAVYERGNYEGYSFVLFEENGKIFEVNGSHCSCNGLEGQWRPEEVDLSEVERRMAEGNLGSGYGFDEGFGPQLKQLLDI